MPGSSNMRGVLSGFRIKSEGIGSYRQRILGYLGGPMSNIISSLLFFAFFRGEYFRMLAMLNMATALSNLLPIEGYDGYGIILSIIEMKECGSLSHRVLTRVSTGLILCFTIFSLYLMDRVGGGYWIFAIFFSFLIKVIDRDISKAF
jgi:Zn-dependent protease